MKYANAASLLVISAQLTSCATAPEHIGATYISPVMYANYDCAQIAQEMQRTAYRVQEVTGQQHSKAVSDEVAMGVGLVLFWPALFLLAMGSDHKAELQSLKGSYDALNEASIQKQCTIAGQSQNTSATQTKTLMQARAISNPPPAPAASPALSGTVTSNPGLKDIGSQNQGARIPAQIEQPSKEETRHCLRYAFRVVGDPAQDQCAVWSQ